MLILVVLLAPACTGGQVTAGVDATGDRGPSGDPQAQPSGSASAAGASTKAFIEPIGAYFARLASCLRGRSRDARVNQIGDGLAVDSVTAGRRAAFHAAKVACDARVGVPPPPEPLSESGIRARYRYLLQARQCLIALGYAITEPPSEDGFVNNWANDPWSPYLDVLQLREEGWQALNRQCPQQ